MSNVTIGTRYRHFTVMEEGPASTNSTARWYCLCNCGAMSLRTASQILKSTTSFCDQCYRVKYLDKNGYIEGTMADGSTFIFDKEDFELVSPYRWRKDCKGYIWYRNPSKNITIRLHRLITDATDGQVDHINRDKSDNRRCNLRMATPSENAINRKLRVTSTSGVTGVTFSTQTNSWRAYITIDKRQVHLGFFDTKEEALEARTKAAAKHYGDFIPI